jgi:hypothetical protein
MKLSTLEHVIIGDVCLSDYPDFCDAFIESATHPDGGGALTDDELEAISEDDETLSFVNEYIHAHQLYLS